MSGDTDYICWLRLNYPDSPLLSRPTEAQTSAPSDESLVRHFSDLAVLTEIPVAYTPSETTKMTPYASTIWVLSLLRCQLLPDERRAVVSSSVN